MNRDNLGLLVGLEPPVRIQIRVIQIQQVLVFVTLA